jgi:hypothetical protein
MEWIIVFPLFHQRFCPRIQNCVMVPRIQGGHPNCTPREQGIAPCCSFASHPRPISGEDSSEANISVLNFQARHGVVANRSAPLGANSCDSRFALGIPCPAYLQRLGSAVNETGSTNGSTTERLSERSIVAEAMFIVCVMIYRPTSPLRLAIRVRHTDRA